MDRSRRARRDRRARVHTVRRWRGRRHHRRPRGRHDPRVRLHGGQDLGRLRHEGEGAHTGQRHVGRDRHHVRARHALHRGVPGPGQLARRLVRRGLAGLRRQRVRRRAAGRLDAYRRHGRR